MAKYSELSDEERLVELALTGTLLFIQALILVFAIVNIVKFLIMKNKWKVYPLFLFYVCSTIDIILLELRYA